MRKWNGDGEDEGLWKSREVGFPFDSRFGCCTKLFCRLYQLAGSLIPPAQLLDKSDEARYRYFFNRKGRRAVGKRR